MFVIYKHVYHFSYNIDNASQKKMIDLPKAIDLKISLTSCLNNVTKLKVNMRDELFILCVEY